MKAFLGPAGKLRSLAFVAMVTFSFSGLFRAPASAQELMTITIAGKAGASGASDGPATDARFAWPSGLAIDGAGTLYVADAHNHAIRGISRSGQVTTLAGTLGLSGHMDGVGSAARFTAPGPLTIDTQGNLFVVDNGSVLRKITRAGVVTTLAGSFGQWGNADGVGAQARFVSPRGLTVDGAGNIYVADTGNRTIRRVSPGGAVTTFAGTFNTNYSITGTGDGVGSNARFGSPSGIVADRAGNLYVSDAVYRSIRKITPQAVVTTIAGTYNGTGIRDGAGAGASFGYPGAMAVHPSGDIYVLEPEAQVVRRVTSAGVVTTPIGIAGLSGAADGRDREARFNWPEGIAIDAAGNLFISDTRNYTVRERLPVYPPTITQPPHPTSVPAGKTTFLSVEATGVPAPAYQWRKDGAAIPGATDRSLTITNARAEDAGNYSIFIANIAGGVLSAPVRLTVIPPPTIVAPPVAQSVADGQTVVLSVTATSPLSLSYRWRRDGTDLPGATHATLTIAEVLPSHAGNYSVVVTNEAGSVAVAPVPVTVLSSRFINLSVRTTAGDGESVLVVGFVVAGNRKPLLVRGNGAILAQYGVPGTLLDPRLAVYRGTTLIAANDDWSSSANAAEIAALAERVGAFALPNPSRDAALFLLASDGAYTAHVSAAPGLTGIALAELYDTDSTGEGRVANLSARAHVGTGENTLIAGFVLAGNARKRVLVRGAGPALAIFGVSGTLGNPRLSVYQNGVAIIASNDDWDGNPAISAAAAQVGAFPFAPASKDAALLLQLDPGAYTAQVSGVANTTGNALVEIYEVR